MGCVLLPYTVQPVRSLCVSECCCASSPRTASHHQQQHPRSTPLSHFPHRYFGFEALTWAKIVPLGFMFFCILFNYTILRDTKDVLVVTAPGSGAEIIPFLKTYVNLPMAIGFTVLYAKVGGCGG